VTFSNLTRLKSTAIQPQNSEIASHHNEQQRTVKSQKNEISRLEAELRAANADAQRAEMLSLKEANTQLDTEVANLEGGNARLQAELADQRQEIAALSQISRQTVPTHQPSPSAVERPTRAMSEPRPMEASGRKPISGSPGRSGPDVSRPPTETRVSSHLSWVRPAAPPSPAKSTPADAALESECADLNGIIALLSEQCKGNVQDKNIVAITASSNGQTAKNAANLADNSMFTSINRPGQWICYDFKKMTIFPSSYSIKSSSIQNWTIEGSRDGREWLTFDRREEENTVPVFGLAKTRDIEFIRIRQTGANRTGDHSLMISGFEIFGTLLATRDADYDIIADLTKQCGGNVHDHKMVTITSSSYFEDSHPKNAADLNSGSVFFSGPEPNQWICYDFHEKVRARAYSVKTDETGPCPKEWVMEGSNDGKSWVVIGKETNDKDGMINQKYQLYCPSFFEMIRLRQTGPNFWGDHQLAVVALEIVGCLVYDRIPTVSPKSMTAELMSPSFPGLNAVQLTHVISNFSRLFVPPSSNPYQGIVTYLRQHFSGDHGYRHMVNVTRSDGKDTVDLPLDKSGSSFAVWVTIARNRWIRYDFKNVTILPTHYAISLSRGDRCSWVIEVSRNGSDWIEIDRRAYKVTSRTGMERVVCETSEKEIIRSIRFVGIENKSYRMSGVYCTGLEFFGYLTE
jgi:hypothetical protein